MFPAWKYLSLNSSMTVNCAFENKALTTDSQQPVLTNVKTNSAVDPKYTKAHYEA